MESDEHYMREALSLAGRGVGATRPNPAVGAVIVDASGAVVGRGWHRRAGMPHAEVEALRDAASSGRDVRGATMFVTLEPCNHQGRTGPCSEAVLSAGIARVVIAAADPHKAASGGAERLRAAGVEVRTGVLAEESRLMNAGFFTTHLLGRPLVTLKWAMTLDGCTSATGGDAKWITGPAARAEVHRRRAAHDALLVGIETVLRDGTRGTIRDVPMPEGITLWRVVLDSSLRLPPGAPFLEPDPISRALVVCGEDADPAREAALKARGAEVLRVAAREERIDIAALLEALSRIGIQSVYVEGGRRVAGSFLAAGAVDRVEAWVAPRLLGGGATHLGPLVLDPAPLAIAEAQALHRVQWTSFGEDLLVEGWRSEHLFTPVS